MNRPERLATAAVIGGGPAGLMAAEQLAASGVAVTVYDRMPSVGRKFLLAGRGGLNLTHSEGLDAFLPRYGAASATLAAAIRAYRPEHLRAWCEALGQPTFVGSSGRVFPQAMKASPLLRAWLRRLDRQGVRFALRHRWIGWDATDGLRFEAPAGPITVRPDATVLALGGASWPQLGADGAWVASATGAGLAVAPFRPANAGSTVAWSPWFRDRFEGTPVKNVAVCFDDRQARGDVMITREGLEGGAIYALSAVLRDSIDAQGAAAITLALRPDLDAAALVGRLAARPAKQSLSTWLRRSLRLAPVAVALLNEGVLGSAEPLAALSPERLAALVNAVPLRLTGTASLARAISAAGGLLFDEIDAQFMLRQRPGTFVAGEMLDWEAPTGGYLLQACFATGTAAGQGAAAWLARGRFSITFPRPE